MELFDLQPEYLNSTTLLMKNLFISAFFIFRSATLFGQTNYFVSPTGSDSNTGSLLMPWQTIQFGLNHLATNDTLNLLTGTFNEKLTIPTNNIYLRNHISTSPVIDATGITAQNAIISINNRSNVTIDGIELKNNIQPDAQGILIDGNGSDITVKNCKIHDIHFSSNINAAVNSSTNAQGIIVYGTNSSTAITNLKIQNNQLYNCRLGYSEGIAVNGNVSGFEISGNSVYNLTNIGIDIIGHEGTCLNPLNDQARNGSVKKNVVHDCLSAYASSGGIYVDGGKNITIENNVSYKNGYGIEIGCENIGKTTDAIDIRNNIFYNNEICAAALGGFDYPNGSGKVMNCNFKNNTCYHDDYSNAGIGELYLSYSENSIIENNIFYTSSQNSIAYVELTQPSLVFNYNTIYCQSGENSLTVDWNGNSYSNYADFVSGTGTNTNSIFADPQFVLASITNPDFHLTSGSLAINNGNPQFVASQNETDMDGEIRTNGIVDCGADENYTSTEIRDESKIKVSLYPNPFNIETKFVSNQVLHNATITVFNQQGQVVDYIQNITGQTITLLRKNLRNGAYYIRLTEGQTTTIKQLIVID